MAGGWESVDYHARNTLGFAHGAKRDICLIEQRCYSADHPIHATMPETRYLKCFIVQVL